MLELQQLRVAAFTKYQDFEALKQERDKNAADLAAAVKERDTLSKCLLAIESDLSDKVEKIAALESICEQYAHEEQYEPDSNVNMRNNMNMTRTCAHQAGVVLQNLLDVDGASRRIWNLQDAITQVVVKQGELNLKFHMANLREGFQDFERALVGDDNKVLVSEPWSVSLDRDGEIYNLEIPPSILSNVITPRLSGLAQILKSTPYSVFHIVNILGH